MARDMSEDWMSENDSREKVEKVVKPPQSPAMKKLRRESRTSWLAKKEARSPIMRQPSILTKKVWRGNLPSICGVGMSCEHRKRRRLPRPPPRNTQRQEDRDM